MKKIYLFLAMMITGFFLAQIPYNTALKDADWFIMKIEWNGTEYFPPDPIGFSVHSNIYDFDSGTALDSRFFNVASGELTFAGNNENYFTMKGVSITLAMYDGENAPAVNEFDGIATGFYFGFAETDRFYFDYEEVFSGKSLIVTNPNGNKIYYSNMILSANESAKNKTQIYPVPAMDVLNISSQNNISSITIQDSTGKMVMNRKTNPEKKMSLNVKNLPSGMYYVIISGKEIQKIIKK